MSEMIRKNTPGQKNNFPSQLYSLSIQCIHQTLYICIIYLLGVFLSGGFFENVKVDKARQAEWVFNSVIIICFFRRSAVAFVSLETSDPLFIHSVGKTLYTQFLCFNVFSFFRLIEIKILTPPRERLTFLIRPKFSYYYYG